VRLRPSYALAAVLVCAGFILAVYGTYTALFHAWLTARCYSEEACAVLRTQFNVRAMAALAGVVLAGAGGVTAWKARQAAKDTVP
jgi:succinate dehydrogenase hydrophobic anchor subunit